jgi:hypothetical protein
VARSSYGTAPGINVPAGIAAVAAGVRRRTISLRPKRCGRHGVAGGAGPLPGIGRKDLNPKPFSPGPGSPDVRFGALARSKSGVDFSQVLHKWHGISRGSLISCGRSIAWGDRQVLKGG